MPSSVSTLPPRIRRIAMAGPLAALLLAWGAAHAGSPDATATAPTEQVTESTPGGATPRQGVDASGQLHLSLAAGGELQMPLPQGFTPLTAEEIAQKFPRGQVPTAVWGNAQRHVTIAVVDSKAHLTPEQLPGIQTIMVQTLPRTVPQIRWAKQDVITLNGQPWVQLEFTSAAIDTDIHNRMLLTSHNGRMLGVNFNATKDSYTAHEAAFEHSLSKLQLKP